MEPAKIDWKRIESIFVEDPFLENINAPKWVDLLAPDLHSFPNHHHDDVSWFCRPDCNHPKTFEDFLKTTTPSPKFSSGFANNLKTQLSDCSNNNRDAKVKRIGKIQSSSMSSDKPQFNEDAENRNPNSSTPPTYHQVKSMKAMTNPSTEKRKPIEDASQTNNAPRLKPTLSARNLFGGREILGQITELCNELKKIAMRTKERETDDKLNTEVSQVVEKKKDVVVVKNEAPQGVLEEVEVKEKERKPLLEVGMEKQEGFQKGSAKEKQRKKKIVDAENIIPVSLNLANVRHKKEERLLQIRTNPPSPQCFSAPRAPTKTTPSKNSKSRLMEKGILQEVKQNKGTAKEETEEKSLAIVDGREATRALDVFWFLKPCTLSS